MSAPTEIVIRVRCDGSDGLQATVGPVSRSGHPLWFEGQALCAVAAAMRKAATTLDERSDLRGALLNASYGWASAGLNASLCRTAPRWDDCIGLVAPDQIAVAA